MLPMEPQPPSPFLMALLTASIHTFFLLITEETFRVKGIFWPELTMPGGVWSPDASEHRSPALRVILTSS